MVALRGQQKTAKNSKLCSICAWWREWIKRTKRNEIPLHGIVYANFTFHIASENDIECQILFNNSFDDSSRGEVKWVWISKTTLKL